MKKQIILKKEALARYLIDFLESHIEFFSEFVSENCEEFDEELSDENIESLDRQCEDFMLELIKELKK